MQAEVFRGQLIYIDTEAGKIQILDRSDNNRVTELNVDADTKLGMENWEGLIGFEIDVVVIDGKTKNIYPVVEEE